MAKMGDNQKGTESGLIAEAVVAGLCDAGVETVVFSPGSRSTPLVLALAGRKKLHKKVVLDERSAAFYALGVASFRHLPVVLVCTSGTAPAHYLPALLEARYQRLPLLVLSADRPTELRDCGAGQTIDQVSLYPPDVVWKIDLSVRVDARGLHRAYTAALAAVRHSRGGPVQINLPLHEPFLPHPPVAYFPTQSPEVPTSVTQAHKLDLTRLQKYKQGLILVGSYPGKVSGKWTEALWQLSDGLGWPVLCDVLNPGRWSSGASRRMVTQYQAIFQKGGEWLREKGLLPEAILQIGSLPTAKSLRIWLETFEGSYWQLQPDAYDRDPTHRGSSWITAELSEVKIPAEGTTDPHYRNRWVALNQKLEGVCGQALDASHPFFEGALYRRILPQLPKGGLLFLANSTPVRDAEHYILPVAEPGLEVRCNRGVNGIDGLVSTAFGLAAGGCPTLAVLGDMAFLHDCAGLRLQQNFQGKLTFLVIQNGGGRIFDHLPIQARKDVFEEFYLTPQEVDCELLCRAHGVEPLRLTENHGLCELDLQLDQKGVRVIFITTDPGKDQERRKEITKLLSHI